LSGNIITFDRTDTVGAYSVDLTTAINSAPDKFVSSGAYDEINNKIVLTLNDASTVEIDTSAIGGGDSIYTADGTLTGNRTVDLDGNDLEISDSANSNTAILKLNSGSGFVVNRNTNGSAVVFQSNGVNHSGFGGLTTYLKSSTVNIGSETGDNGLQIEGDRVRYYTTVNGTGDVAAGQIHDIHAEVFSVFKRGFDRPYNSYFSVGSYNRIGIENISLQGSTLIKGNGTSTGSALAIYDNDTTPTKLWDFLDNGDLTKGDTILKVGNSNVITGSGTHRFIYGTGNDINGTSKIWQFAVGVDNELSGSNHGAFGRLNTTTGLGTQYAFGSKNQLNGSYAFAFGGDNVNTKNFTFNFGMATSATAIGAFVIGYGDSTNFNNKLVNNTGNSLALGWNTTTPQHLFKSDGVNLTLPTSATGLSSGDLWNDGGTVKIA